MSDCYTTLLQQYLLHATVSMTPNTKLSLTHISRVPAGNMSLSPTPNTTCPAAALGLNVQTSRAREKAQMLHDTKRCNGNTARHATDGFTAPRGNYDSCGRCWCKPHTQLMPRPHRDTPDTPNPPNHLLQKHQTLIAHNCHTWSSELKIKSTQQSPAQQSTAQLKAMTAPQLA